MTGGNPEVRSDFIDIWYLTFDIQPMDQWTNGPMVHWSNEPTTQLSNGPMDHTLMQCSIAISRLDGIGMEYITCTSIEFFVDFWLFTILGLKEALTRSEDF